MAAYVRSWTPKLWLGSRGGPHVKNLSSFFSHDWSNREVATGLITRPCVSSRLWINSRKSHCGDYDHSISTIGFPIRVGVNSDSAIPIPIPAKLKFTIPWLAIPIPILQLQFLFFFNLIWKSSATMNYCRFKIKMPSYQHRNSHYKGVMVLWLSYVYNVHPYVYNVDPYTSYLEKQSLYVLNTFFVGISFVFVIIWMRSCGLKW